MENENMLSDSLKNMLDGASALFDTKKVIGEPYTVGDTTIIPFIETFVGMGVGSYSSEKNAGGMGMKVTPFACLVIQNGYTKMISLTSNDPITKALDMIPDLVDKLSGNEMPKEVYDKVNELRLKANDNGKKKLKK